MLAERGLGRTCKGSVTNHNTPGQTECMPLIEISLDVVCLCPMTNCYLLELQRTKYTFWSFVCFRYPKYSLHVPVAFEKFCFMKGAHCTSGIGDQKQKEWDTWLKMTADVVHLYQILWLSSTLYKVIGRRI